MSNTIGDVNGRASIERRTRLKRGVEARDKKDGQNTYLEVATGVVRRHLQATSDDPFGAQLDGLWPGGGFDEVEDRREEDGGKECGEHLAERHCQNGIEG